ncbi:MAG: DUF1376 domain-containing protein [Syntrophaceae bacterium]
MPKRGIELGKAPAFQLYSNDFFVDTITWELDELGLYSRLLFVEWSNGPLPNDPKKLAKIAGISPKKFSNLFQIVSLKFTVNDDGNLINPRLEQERERQSKYSESRKEIANKRWDKKDTDAMHMHQHTDMHTGCLSSSSSLKDINTLVISGANDEKQSIPYQDILNLFCKYLPMLPKPNGLSQERRNVLKARWHQDKEYQDLVWWEQFFQFIAKECPFLIGQGEKHFMVSWDWIMKKANFTKIVEGNYQK